MTNKPLKKSEQNRLNKEMERRKRQNSTCPISTLPPYIFIVSEGTKTEPNYIKEMAGIINSKFFNFSPKERVKIHGAARNTLDLLDYARKTVEKEMPEAQVVWLVYDKDSFPVDNFDNTQFSAESRLDKREYRVAWSNECFELWLLLHFQEMDSDTGRAHCREILRKYIPDFEKGMEDIYERLKDKLKDAIKRAKKQYKSYPSDYPPSKMCPATRVYELVEFLQKYID